MGFLRDSMAGILWQRIIKVTAKCFSGMFKFPNVNLPEEIRNIARPD